MKSLFRFTGVPDFWVVQFSQSQQAFSVCEFNDTVLENLALFFEAKPTDHAIIAVAETHDEAVVLSEILNERKDRSIEFGSKEVESILNKLVQVEVLHLKSGPSIS